MKYRYINRICVFVILILFAVFYVSFVDVSPVNAWAKASGKVKYKDRGLNNVIIVDNTTKSTDTSGNDDREDRLERETNWDRNNDEPADVPEDEPADVPNDRFERETNWDRWDSNVLGLSVLSGSTTTGGDGKFSFDRVDCGADPSTKNISVQGFAGAPPDGVPVGGYFSPSTISLGDFNNAAVLGPYTIEYIPPRPIQQPTPISTPFPTTLPLPTATPLPSPTPTITLTPLPVCGGPCNFINTNCPLECAICAPGPAGKNICSKTHTDSLGVFSSAGPYANSLKPQNYTDFPIPTMSFMGIKLGTIKPTPTPR